MAEIYNKPGKRGNYADKAGGSAILLFIERRI